MGVYVLTRMLCASYRLVNCLVSLLILHVGGPGASLTCGDGQQVSCPCTSGSGKADKSCSVQSQRRQTTSARR